MLRAVSVATALREACATLEDAGVEDGWLNAELLLASAMGVSRTALHAAQETPLTPDGAFLFSTLVERRSRREPLAYLLGRQEFYGMEFLVTPAVLVPRPETETLVEAVLQWAEGRGYDCARGLGGDGGRAAPRHESGRAAGAETLRIADVGTGSGCVAVALAKLLPTACVVAMDSSGKALAVARRNAARQGVAERVSFFQGHLLRPLEQPVDLVVANLPYVGAREFAGLQPEIRDYEPRGALVSGDGGLALNTGLLRAAKTKLRPSGACFLEFSPPQRRRLEQIARACFPEARVTVLQDMAARDRVIAVQLRPFPAPSRQGRKEHELHKFSG